MQNKIIEFLKRSPDFISGEDISRQIKVSRAAIWKNIQELRKAGYEIEAAPNLGYKLLSSPDKLFAHEIHTGLDTKKIGRKIEYFESVDSTMNVAYRLGMEGEKEGTVVIAETQTKGKGRLGRSWSSPKYKGIYMSVLLRPRVSSLDVPKLTLLSAVAVCEAVRNICPLDVKIKWPNDLLVNDKKIAGILTEINAEMDQVRFCVLGVGINVNTPTGSLVQGATSLKAEMDKFISRVSLAREILSVLEKWYTVFEQKGSSPILSRWKELSSTIGKKVRVVDPSGEVQGKAVDIDRDGGLIVQIPSGETIKRLTGDVIQIK